MAIFVKHNSLILFSFTLSLGVGLFQALPAQAGSNPEQYAPSVRFKFAPNYWAEDGPTGRVNKDLCIPPRSQVQPQALPQRQVAGDRNFLQSVKPALVTQSLPTVQRVSTVQKIPTVQNAPSPQYVLNPPVQPLSAQPGAVQPRIVCGDGEVYIYPPVSPPKVSTPLGAPANRGVRPGVNNRVNARLMPSNDSAKVPTLMTYGGKGFAPGSVMPVGSDMHCVGVVSGKVRPKGE